ncbi:MAG: DUF2764 domain-containing protein [Rikenellaceae bacterium]|nr:DUF2764 domain-containing protein [Rikenellaceae bacterium]
MAGKYYFIIGGLKEYDFDTGAKGFDAVAIRDDIYENLSPVDAKYMRDFYTYYDILNIIALYSGRDAFSRLGFFSREELQAEIEAPEELPDYLTTVIATYRSVVKEIKYIDTDPSIDTEKPIERALWRAYYEHCMSSECRFLRKWYGFDMELRNITAAFTARRMGRDIGAELVGDADIISSLARSSAPDFGIRNEVDYMDRLVGILEESNILEKERKLDLLKWDMADRFAEQHYFDMEVILAYCAKVNIIDRWLTLDRRTGEEMFRKMVAEVSDKNLLVQSVFQVGNPRARNTEIE